MEKEYFGIFADKSKYGVFKQACRVVLEENSISLYFTEKNGVKFREFKAESISSFEDEKLIRINRPQNLALEAFCSFLGAVLLPLSFVLGLIIVGFSFLSALKKTPKTYILLCKPVNNKYAGLKLFKISGIKTKSPRTVYKAA